MERTEYHRELLINRLSKRFKHLKKWASRTGTNAFRLYDRDIPEIPLVLDIYDDAISGAYYRYTEQTEESPGEKTESWLLAMKEAISEVLKIKEDNIFLKERFRMRGRQDTGIQYGKLSTRSFYRDVSEGDLKFRVNLSDYLDTGLFLDARKKRAMIRSMAAGKRVLNLFAYTCSLSLAAAKGGALELDSVDLSATYLDWGKINFALNKLDVKSGFNFIQSDVIDFLEKAERKKLVWDLIILDPPSFSNSKKMRGALDLKRDYLKLLSSCLALLGPGGTLVFSSNSGGFKIGEEESKKAAFNNVIVKELTDELVDEDFLRRKVPVCYTIKRQ